MNSSDKLRRRTAIRFAPVATAVLALAVGTLTVASTTGCCFNTEFTMLHVTVTDARTGAPISDVRFTSDGKDAGAVCEQEPASGPCRVFVVTRVNAIRVSAPGYAAQALPADATDGDTDACGGADASTSIALVPTS